MPHNAAKKKKKTTTTTNKQTAEQEDQLETFSQVNQVRTEDWNQRGEVKRNRTAVGNWEGSLGDS